MATENSVMAVIRASRPSFRNPHDKVAFAVHASFLAAGYVLRATGAPAFSETALSSSPSDEVGIEGWNETDDAYAFVYSKEEKGAKKLVLVKCLVMGDSLIVDALGDGDGEKKPVNFQINVNDCNGSEGTNYSEMYKNFGKLVSSLKSNILDKLDESSTASSSTSSLSRSKTSERPEYEMDEPGVGVTEPRGYHPYPSGLIYPPVPSFGESDLYPGPGAGVFPSRGTGIGGGMLLGPNDPRWFGGIGGEPSRFPGRAPGVPPGARFDPYGPPGVPGFEPNRFVRNPRRPGGGTHPDLEHFRDDSDII